MTIRELIAPETAIPSTWIRRLMLTSVTGIVAAIVFQFFQLLKEQPKEALAMLSQWGPNFLLWILVLAIIGGLLSQFIEITRDGVAAQRQMAEAMAKIAEKDDRQIAEIQTVGAYAAQQSDKLIEKMNQQAEENRRNWERMQLHFEKITAHLDARGIQDSSKGTTT